MTKILEILEEFLIEVEKDNPYNLIAKGGTTLSLLYLNNHRDSEDLDFDTNLDKNEYKNIESYFLKILKNLKQKGIIKNFHKAKSGLASTNRYHMNVVLETYKEFHTKIDVDFGKCTKKLNKKGELLYYPIERLFIGKLITFIDRKEFKDIYDIKHILPKIDIKKFLDNPNVTKLVDDFVDVIQGEDIVSIYKKAFKNVDLRFKNLKESEIESFIQKLIRDLRIFKNKIKK